jgi:nicotinate phosphoribosyltransferase
VRVLNDGVALEERIYVEEKLVASLDERPLHVTLMTDGVPEPRFLGAEGTALAREHRALAIAELPANAHRLSRGEPALPTIYR